MLLTLIEAGDGERAEACWRKHLESIDKLIGDNFADDRAIDLLEHQAGYCIARGCRPCWAALAKSR